MKKEKIYLYPVWVRSWHIINALLCLLLILTGISMQYSDPQYPLIRFDISVSIHNIGGVLLSLGYLYFIIGNIVTTNGKYYKSKFNGLAKELAMQAKYYSIGIFKKEKAPFPITETRKFNPLQKISYVVIMYIIFPIIILSGWVLLYPEFILHDLFAVQGLHLTDILHVITGFIVSLFLIVHVYFCTIGHTAISNFKSMITGWHDPH